VEDESRNWVEAKNGWSAKDWWLDGHRLPPFFLSPPLSNHLAQPPHLWDKVEGPWPHGRVARPPPLAGRPPLGSPIKGLPRGAFSFITQAHKQIKFSESFSMFLACLSWCESLTVKVESSGSS
jgi:hypothetical protein